MRAIARVWIAATFAMAAMAAWGQQPAATAARSPDGAATVQVAQAGVEIAIGAAELHVPTVQQLLEFNNSDVKFDLNDLMATLMDRRHEGWVLAAYPDPKTGRPLIGAGFSLDLPERAHAQIDPLNAHPFLEPSSAELWQASGLDNARLDKILVQYDENLAAWKKKRFRKKIASLPAQITEDEAKGLLRVAAIQAIYNAKAYCRNFDRYTAAQQMALSQLVYQMGVNLAEFSQFLNLINSDAAAQPAMEAASLNPEAAYWKAVQSSLIESQWARAYRGRAVAVIAMLDPGYTDSSTAAERRVSATLRPARRKASLRTVALRRGHKRKTRARKD
jgi:hypothetical protein